MATDKIGKHVLSFLAVLCFIIPSTVSYADRADEGFCVKGTSSAYDTEIDKSLYVDGSKYENIDYGVETMRIGISYGDSAPEEIELKNLSGQGFLIGFYDENRNFNEVSQTGASKILAQIKCDGGKWHILPEKDFVSAEEFKNAVSDFTSLEYKIDGENREVYGEFSTRAEARRLIKELKISGYPWYDGKGSIRLIEPKSETIIYETEYGNSRLAVMPIGEGSQCFYMDNQYKGGFEFRMHDAQHLNLINYIGLEDYIKGVIPYEMSYSWPFEALKAQAVCARTYAIYNLDRFKEYGFDLTADTYSQVYRGTLEANETSDAAVDETEGELVRYNGQACEIYYCSSNGGATEDGINVFDTSAPYLSGKTDPFESALDFPLKEWELKRSTDKIAEMLQDWGYDIESVAELFPEYSDTGNVIAINFVDEEGNYLEVRGRSCYNALGLYSCRFKIQRDEDNFIFTGTGWGHNCGMSQWGANAMASVYGYNYQDILRFYFSGAYVA